MTDRTLPVTAIVASHDEAHLLERSLPALAFCDEVIVIDIASTDATSAVASRHGARVVRWELVPIAEWARASVADEARHEWLLLSDPDEVVPPELARTLRETLPVVPSDVGLVWAPIRYHVGGRPLQGTIWGGENRRRLLARRSGVEFVPAVFAGTRLRPGFRRLDLPFDEEIAISHYWVSGYRDWIRKHLRYLGLQSRDRADAGEVTGLRAVATAPMRAFYDCFVTKRGYADGFVGLVLSVLWATFAVASEVGLLRELRRRRPR